MSPKNLSASRRSFIKTSATTIIAGYMGGLGCKTAVTESTNQLKPPAKKLGIALLGLGYYSKNLLAPALQLTEHCELRSIITGSPDKILVWQKKYGIKDSNIYSYENMSDIANNLEIDVVYIVVPTALHAKYSILAAEAGKHVWCEKPMAMNVKECESIISACERNKVRLAIGYRMQHEPNTQTLISYRDSQPYSKFNEILADAGYRGGGGTDWRHKKAMGGGALYDMGVYTVNGIRYASGMMPTKVLSAKHIITRPELFPEVDETTEYTLAFADGRMAKGRTSVGQEYNRLRVECEKGWYELAPFQSYDGVQGITSDGILLNKPIANQQARQMDDDALAIINNTDMMAPGIEGLKDIQIINAIQKAAASQSEVTI